MAVCVQSLKFAVDSRIHAPISGPTLIVIAPPLKAVTRTVVCEGSAAVLPPPPFFFLITGRTDVFWFIVTVVGFDCGRPFTIHAVHR